MEYVQPDLYPDKLPWLREVERVQMVDENMNLFETTKRICDGSNNNTAGMCIEPLTAWQKATALNHRLELLDLTRGTTLPGILHLTVFHKLLYLGSKLSIPREHFREAFHLPPRPPKVA